MKKLFYLTVMLAAILWSCDKNEDELDGENEEGVITMVAKTDKIEYLEIESFKEGETITIDWGDGTEEKFETMAEYNDDDDEFWYWTDELEHSYPNSNRHTITIKGNIKGLACGYNNLSSLDVSKCTALTHLYCYDNNLTSLDVSKCTALTELYCSNNNLTSLNVSKGTALTELSCYYNNLSSLDVSKCTALMKLECDYNNLSSLNVSGCTALTGCLSCIENHLSADALNKIFKDLPKGEIDEYGRSNIFIGDNPGTETCNRSIAEKKGWNVQDYED